MLFVIAVVGFVLFVWDFLVQDSVIWRVEIIENMVIVEFLESGVMPVG